MPTVTAMKYLHDLLEYYLVKDIKPRTQEYFSLYFFMCPSFYQLTKKNIYDTAATIIIFTID